MTPTLESLGLDRLSRTDKLAVVQALWDSIAAEREPVPISDALRRELSRRVDDDDANPDDVVPWEEVKAQARARRRK